ncbi:TonB-dependent receptor [Pseudopedobacter beijingensis]|uniref:TonB-dependent receptor n=1 Tax=Pseudopedobacter beijingensis TaxID=1207056 RepID=A0ABW4IFG5_9SPHI
MQTSFAANAQKISISERNTSIGQIFKKINQNFGYEFVYTEEMLKESKLVTISIKDASIEEVLEKCFEGQPLSYRITENTIIVQRKSATMQPQLQPIKKIKITGKILDEQNIPLPGAIVRIKGTGTRVMADKDGRYTIETESGSKLMFSYLGFEEKEVSIAGKTVIDVILKEQISKLEEVYVIGYGTVKKEDATGAVGQVDVEAVEKAPVYSVEQALAGRVAGLSVSASQGQPGEEGTNIQIRGVGSITQDTSPLYVIDGFATENFNLGSLNPEDIESINVLKDASSTAIYGSRGANGVIVIETKKGKEGKPILAYSGSMGIQSVVKKIDLMTPYDFVKVEFERDPVSAESAYIRGGKTIEDYKDIQGVNWQNQFFQTGKTNIHNISLRGGNKDTKYALSGSVYGTDAVALNTGLKRQQGRLSIDQVVNRKIKAGLNVNYTHVQSFGQITSRINDGYASSALMFSVWGYRPVSRAFLEEDFDVSSFEEDLFDDEVISSTDYRINPIQSAKNTYRNRDNNSLLSNAFFTYNLFKDVVFKATGSINLNTVQLGQFYNSGTWQGSPQNLRNSYGQWGSMAYSKQFTWSNENTITYIKKYRQSKMTLLGGMTLQKALNEGNSYTAIKVPNESLGITGLGKGTPLSVNSYGSYNTLNSYFVRGDFNYNSKYMITGTFRADGSSKFPENKWGFFPSGAFAWRMSEEEFIKNLNVVSDAKLRISYGVTGNNRVGDFSALSPISVANSVSYSFGNDTPIPVAVPGIGNLGLKWETTAQFNIGYDLSVFKNRLELIVDYYDKRTNNLLLNANMPASSGYTQAYKNVGKLSNKGMEFTLNTKNIMKKDFKWTSNFNISFNKNTVLELADGQDKLLSRIAPRWQSGYADAILYSAAIGQSIGNFAGFIFDGLYQLEDFEPGSNGTYILKNSVPSYGAGVKPGYIKYKDLNHDGEITTADQTIIGRGLPIHVGGFSNNFQYKNFSLNLFFQWSYGNDIYNANQLVFESNPQIMLNQYASFANRWSPTNTNTTIPVVGGVPQGYYSTRELSDGSYLRFKTVFFAYEIPKKFSRRYGFSNISLTASAQNLFTITNYSGVDPEVSTYNSILTPGFDYSAYPTAKTIVFGLKASL